MPKAVFPTGNNLRKMLHHASKDIVNKWAQRCRDWDAVLKHLALMFEDRQTS